MHKKSPGDIFDSKTRHHNGHFDTLHMHEWGGCMGGLSGPRTMLSVSRFWTEWSYQLPGIKSIDSDVPVRSPANIRSYESGVGSLLWNIQQQKKGLGIWMTCSLFQLKYRCWVILKKTNKAVTSRTEVRTKDKAR